jgi:short-subunit dehydrogenase
MVPSPLRDRFGPWAVVTGASDGIGRAIARQLAAAGVNLVLVARRREHLEALGEELAGGCGITVRPLAIDLARPEGPERLLAATAELDVGLLVAAAGFGSAGRFLEADRETQLEMVDLNCRAVAALAHGFGSRLVARGRGALVLFSSLLAFQGVPLAANYAATKAYVQSLAEGLRQELAPAGVRVLVAAPGPVHTGFAARAAMRMTAAQQPEEVAAATLAALDRGGTVLPGVRSRLLGCLLLLLPRGVRVRLMGRVMAPMVAPGDSGGYP